MQVDYMKRILRNLFAKRIKSYNLHLFQSLMYIPIDDEYIDMIAGESDIKNIYINTRFIKEYLSIYGMDKTLKVICSIISHESLHMLLAFESEHTSDCLDNLCDNLDYTYTDCGGL